MVTQPKRDSSLRRSTPLAASTPRTSRSLLDALADAASMIDPGSAGLIRQFRDRQYHRTGFTIGGSCGVAVARASIEVSRQALLSVDLRLHEASHPRVGVVDHVSVHPLGESGEAVAREAGLMIATALGEEGVPVLLYGDLKNGRRLAEVRVGWTTASYKWNNAGGRNWHVLRPNRLLAISFSLYGTLEHYYIVIRCASSSTALSRYMVDVSSMMLSPVQVALCTVSWNIVR